MCVIYGSSSLDVYQYSSEVGCEVHEVGIVPIELYICEVHEAGIVPIELCMCEVYEEDIDA